MAYVLRPVGAGAKHLKKLRIEKDGEGFSLGRNTFTFSDEDSDNCLYVSRKHAELKRIGDELFITAYPRTAALIELNGVKIATTTKKSLVPGDILSLLGNKSFFNYEIRKDETKRLTGDGVAEVETMKKRRLLDASLLSSGDDDDEISDRTCSNSSSNGTAVAGVSQTNREHVLAPASPPVRVLPEKSEIERGLECGICFELIACGHCISSCDCGATYCYSCVVDSAQNRCPTCSAAFTDAQLLHNRTVDGLVRMLLKASPDELRVWEHRFQEQLSRKKGLPPPPPLPPPPLSVIKAPSATTALGSSSSTVRGQFPSETVITSSINDHAKSNNSNNNSSANSSGRSGLLSERRLTLSTSSSSAAAPVPSSSSSSSRSTALIDLTTDDSPTLASGSAPAPAHVYVLDAAPTSATAVVSAVGAAGHWRRKHK